MFEYFIRNARTDIYNIMYFLTTPDKQQPKYVEYARNVGGRTIPNNTTTVAL